MVPIKHMADIIEAMLPKRRPIEHHEPFIDKKRASVEISQCLASGIQRYDKIELFENWLKVLTGSKYVLATNSGTSALHLSLLALGIKPQDEVLIPTTTFVATANAVSYVGAIPHFIDAAPNIDTERLANYLSMKSHKEGGRIKAIIVVHLFGIPADIEGICRVADAYNIAVIEDASQALGTKIGTCNGEIAHVGTFGRCGVLSFNNNKILTTNGGGAMLTNDLDIYNEVKSLATTARRPHKWLIEHEKVAYNYRMGAVNASLGMVQALDFGRILAVKRSLAKKYRERIGHMTKFVEPKIKCDQNHWLNVILVEKREELLEELHKRDIKARASFSPLHLSKFYQRTDENYVSNVQEQNMEKSIEFFQRAVCLPSGAGL